MGRPLKTLSVILKERESRLWGSWRHECIWDWVESWNSPSASDRWDKASMVMRNVLFYFIFPWIALEALSFIECGMLQDSWNYARYGIKINFSILFLVKSMLTCRIVTRKSSKDWKLLELWKTRVKLINANWCFFTRKKIVSANYCLLCASFEWYNSILLLIVSLQLGQLHLNIILNKIQSNPI